MVYYDEVETSSILNKEVRDDALHAFIAGLKRPFKSLVLPELPTSR